MKRILLVTDVKGWAWWHMAQGLKRYQPQDLEFTVITQAEFWLFTKESQFLLKPFDAVLQFSWMEATHRGTENQVPLPKNCTLLASHGAEYSYPPKLGFIPAKIATHIRNREAAALSLPKFDKVLCVSPRLKAVADDLGSDAVLTLPGVDHRQFPSIPIRDKGVIVVGWCGQSKGVTKGYHEVLQPLMERYRTSGIKFHVLDRSAENALPHSQMVLWYSALDVLLSTSCSEGGPMPPLEAMSCGRPVIATDVGCIPHFMRDGETGWILPAWKTAEEAAVIVDQLDGLLRSLNIREIQHRGKASRQRVEDEFTWETRSAEWAKAILS